MFFGLICKSILGKVGKKNLLVLSWSLRSLVKFGIITQAEARCFPTKLLCSSFCSAVSEPHVFWSLYTEEGLSCCKQHGTLVVLDAWHGPWAS